MADELSIGWHSFELRAGALGLLSSVSESFRGHCPEDLGFLYIHC